MSGSAILMMLVGVIIIWGGLFVSIFYATVLTKFRNKYKVADEHLEDSDGFGSDEDRIHTTKVEH